MHHACDACHLPACISEYGETWHACGVLQVLIGLREGGATRDPLCAWTTHVLIGSAPSQAELNALASHFDAYGRVARVRLPMPNAPCPTPHARMHHLPLACTLDMCHHRHRHRRATARHDSNAPALRCVVMYTPNFLLPNCAVPFGNRIERGSIYLCCWAAGGEAAVAGCVRGGAALRGPTARAPGAAAARRAVRRICSHGLGEWLPHSTTSLPQLPRGLCRSAQAWHASTCMQL